MLTMMTVAPVERYSMTACDLYRTVPPLLDPSFVGNLVSLQPERLACDLASNGMRIATSQHDEDEGTQQETTTSTVQETPLLESQQTLESFQENLAKNTSGFALAVWFSPAPESFFKMQPILTLGLQTPPVLPDDFYTPGCPGYDLQVVQFQQKIFISYTDGDPGRSCRYLGVPNFNLLHQANELIHVIVTFDSVYTSIYVNGLGQVLGARNIFDPSLQHWTMENNTLQLFGAYASEDTFGGAIMQVDLFGSTLNGTQVADLYDEGPYYAAPPPVAVFAQAQENGTMIRQDELTVPLTLQLGSANSTSTVLQLQVDLLSLPKHGRLVSTSSGSTSNIGTGTRLPIEMGESSAFVQYELLSDDYFNQPTVNAHGDSLDLESESFDFRILACDPKNTERLLATSTTVTQIVHVAHVNHPPTRLDAPDEAVLDNVDTSLAVIVGIAFEDDPRDFSMDRVRVDVSADHGNVSLASPLRSLADFDSCRSRSLSAWRCVDGPARSITFVALPDYVSLILRHLEYSRLSPGDADEIVVRVFDGAGGMCLDNAEHWEYQHSIMMDDDSNNMNNFFPTIRDDCFQVQASIGVPSYDIKNPNKKKDDSRGFFDVPDLLFFGLLIVLVAPCAWCLRRQCPSFMARGAAVEVDNDDDESPEEPVEPKEQL